MNIARSLILFGAVVVAGLAVSVGISRYAFEELKINGPVYQDIVHGKDLIADILPPPLFVVESYMLANEMLVHPSAAADNAAQIAALEALYEERRLYWQASTLDAALRSGLETEVLASGDAYWAKMSDGFLPAMSAGDLPAATAALDDLFTVFHAHKARVDTLVAEATSYLETAETTARAKGSAFSTATTIASLASILIFLAGLYMIRRRAIVPLTGMKDYMKVLSGGDYSQDVPFSDRKDEIGDMAGSVVEFRKAAMERQANRVARDKARDEQQAMDAVTAVERARQEAERARVIEALTEGLEQLSAGNLTFRIDQAFAPDYEKLRSEFNSSIGALASTLKEIAGSTNSVRLSAAEIGSASDDLSRRTEQQAASLEETAAALDEITVTIRSSTHRADEASAMVATAKSGAEKSGQVVRNAIIAMEKIEDSSRQIGQIISVIDDIAFQTNLLALNAGVEAARAGEAGRGFAVVAQEVRELAGRSAKAAKEIKTLIDTSSGQVNSGVALVNATGKALGDIEQQVGKINEHIQSIVTGSREQAGALGEINAAINQMDQMTQQNAAMVEQTNAATQGLSSETVTLEGLVNRFRTEANPRQPVTARQGHRNATHSNANAGTRPAASPARSLGANVAKALAGGGGATAVAWDDF